MSQYCEILTLASWIALLIACIENDSGDHQATESTRQAALSLGKRPIMPRSGTGRTNTASISLTTGNYHGVITAERCGARWYEAVHSVAVQLFA